jgi:Lysophospholipase
MRYTMMAAALMAAVLGGCVPLPSDTVKNNAYMAAHAITLPSHPASDGHYADGTRVVARDLTAPFGRLHSVLVESDSKKPLIVFCGGRSFREENAGADIAEPLSAFGDVLLYDYPGFGSSGGSGTRAEFAQAEKVMAEAVSTLAANRSGPVIFWGHSLGGGICASLAAHTPVKSALVLATTFAAYDDFKDNLLGIFSPLVTLKVPDDVIAYNAPELLKAYSGAIIVVTLTEDETVPYAVEKRLAAKLQEAGRKVHVVTIAGKGHGTLHALPDFHAKMQSALEEAHIAAGN